MGEAIAVKREVAPISLLDRMNDVFEALSRRAFEIFERNGRALGRDLDDWLQAEREMLHPLHIKINETDNVLEVRVEVPGFSEKELEIAVDPHRLTITGKRESKKEEKKGKTYYAEACADQILRVVDLPAEVLADKVTATLKNGVLELTMPKAAQPQTIRIQPKAA